MVLGTSLIRKQCISCACVTRDSISFPKQFCLAQKFTNKQKMGRGEEGRAKNAIGFAMYSVRKH